MIRASILSNLVLPRQLVLLQQVVLLILSLVLTRELELVTHGFRVAQQLVLRDNRFATGGMSKELSLAMVLANLHCQTAAEPPLSPWITCSQHLWSKGNAGQCFRGRAGQRVDGDTPKTRSGVFCTSRFSLELAYLLANGFLIDPAVCPPSWFTSER